MKTETNKWKIGFWIYFAISIILILFLFAKNSNGEVNLAFTKMDKILVEQDLKLITKIVNNTDLSKQEILNEITKDKPKMIEKKEENKIEFDRIILNFENDKLEKIEIKKSEVDFLLNGK